MLNNLLLNETIEKELNECLDTISIEPLRNFVLKVLNEASSEEKIEHAIEVTKWLIFLLKNDKILSEGTQTLATDLIISSTLLHNISYEYGSKDISSLFKTRTILNEINECQEIKMPEQYIDAISQSIETQLGKDNECKLLIPNPNTPGSHVALACAIYYKKIVALAK